MITLFDVITVTCFIGLVIAFFRFTEQDTRTLLQFLVSGIAFAIANQVGNAGSAALATVLIIAGVGYSWINVRQ
jgi:hypothetical protein